MDLTGIGEVATAAKGILGMIFPDKTEEDKAKLAATLALVTAQTDIDKAEAQSSDPIQHFRGGAGWVCVFGLAYNFIVQPVLRDVSTIAGHAIVLQPLDIGPLLTLLGGMLGLGTMHLFGQIKGVK